MRIREPKRRRMARRVHTSYYAFKTYDRDTNSMRKSGRTKIKKNSHTTLYVESIGIRDKVTFLRAYRLF